MAFTVVVVLATAAWLAVVHLLSLAGVPLVFSQIWVWIAWLCWLRFVFPRRRRRDIARPASMRYRRAFFRDVLPGIACTFAQLLRPLVESAAGSAAVSSMAGTAIAGCCLMAGLGLIVLGAKALGIARTLFVMEYSDSAPSIVTCGIYRHIRHPLFVGGTLVSIAGGLMFAPSIGLWLAIVNVVVVPFYTRVEDMRCLAVFGRQYQDYCSQVHAVVPGFGTAPGTPPTSPASLSRWAAGRAPR